MTKKGLFSIFLLLTGILVFTSSCSSDDNEDRQNDALEFDATPAQDYDGISIDFKLLNSDNMALKSFREGEDILFSLKIENNRDSVVVMPTITELAKDMFHVYSVTGKDFGKPWDTILTGLGATFFFTGTPKTFRYSWLGGIEEYPVEELQKESYATFRRMTLRSPLPKGDYYSQFEITIDGGRKIVCRKDFTVK